MYNFLCEYTVKCNLFLIKAEFIIITPVFRVTWSSRNHSNMRIWWSRNSYDYYQCWTQMCCFIFLWKPSYILSFM